MSVGKTNVKKERPLEEIFYPFIGSRSGAAGWVEGALALGLAMLLLLH